MSGQTLTDRIAAAQYSLTGSEVARAVCKATTHEQTAPKKKHLEYLIQATQETNVNVPQMADTLIERAGNASWVVVFKALIATHHLMVHGNEKFLQFLSSRNTLFNLANFLDKTGSHGYDMSTFIRRYSRYLNEKSFAYRQMSFDFVRAKKGAEGVMRTMSVEKLLKGMPTLQSQIDSLLDFEVHAQDLNNGVINACFLLLFKDLIKLYACYNDGIINLLEKFFQMKRSQCKDGLEIYKRFLTRMTRVSEFFKIAEQVGIDKNDIPELTQAPESLLESLETHLNTLEGKKPEDKSPTKDATANNSSPAAAAAAVVAPARHAPAVPAGGPPARPGPPAKPPPPSITPTAPVPTATTTSNALDDGFLLDLDPMSSSRGATATSSMTGWGDLLAEATPPATDEASEALLAEGESADADDAAAAAPATPAPKAAAATIATAAAAAAPAPASLPISAPTSSADIDLFGDAFAPSPGDGPSAVAAGPASDAFGGSDPFATTEGSGDIAPELDLFAMRPTDTGATAATPPTSSEAPTIVVPIAAPAVLTPSSTTTTDTTTTESAAAPTLDIFGDMFDSMPEQSPTTESKAATTPSVDLFGSDLPAVSRGPSPLPEPAPVGDIVTDSFTSPAAAVAPIPEAPSPPKAEPEPVIDLLDSFGGSVEETQSSAPGGPGDDLLGGLMSPTLAPTAAPALVPAFAPVQNNLLESGFDALGSLTSPAPPVPAAVPIVPSIPEPATTTPAPSGGFDASMFDGLGDLLMPAITPQSTGGSTAGSAAGSMGTPVAAGGIAAATPPPTKTVGGDLDSSLANLIGDLGVKKKDPQSEKKLTGGANWMPHVVPTSWATPGAPMAGAAPGAPGAPGAAMVPPMSAQPGFGMPPAGGPGAPLMQPLMGQPMMGQPMMRPPFTGVAGAAAPGAPIPPGPASQSPKKPKDPLAELDLKDFL
ncbi:clathrin coat assembly protein AP180 isoform X1 [Sander lucioperca]|uniref:clathrin coat assembly protein AP180 isoform X1 n=1 Tax=Sander lucioperca TaxID=283035 RepID=UPI00125CD736|nr:clathrin coat assembly protein AP180 isoform X1 [Sander lucioperca]XP_035861768.1 clathrin coat assembly protein AP180 isoform X1 [Sander lucioperca]